MVGFFSCLKVFTIFLHKIIMAGRIVKVLYKTNGIPGYIPLAIMRTALEHGAEPLRMSIPTPEFRTNAIRSISIRVPKRGPDKSYWSNERFMAACRRHEEYYITIFDVYQNQDHEGVPVPTIPLVTARFPKTTRAARNRAMGRRC